jgi:hypothetical protein
MRTKMSTGIVRLLLLLAAATVTGAQPLAQLPQTLEGAWNVTITAQGSVLCTAPAVFSREGTVIADPCSGSQLGVGYGAWIRTGNPEFAGTFIGSVYNGTTGQIIGTYKVRSVGTLHPDRETLTGVFKTETYDLSGNLVNTVHGTLLGRRIQVEMLH